MQLNRVLPLLKQTYTEWNNHDAPRFGAALAFYTILSIAPLLILVIGVVALVFGHSTAQDQIVGQVQGMIGSQGAEAVKNMIQHAQKPSSGIVASVLGVITLLFGASGVFGELRTSLNKMWDAEPKSAGGIIALIKERFFSFGMVLAIGFLLLVSLVLSAALAVLGKFFGNFLPMPEFVLHLINFLVSLIGIAVLFALIFKYVPAERLPWRSIWFGAVATAFLFTLGKFLIGLYLGKASVGSAYGAAGSLVVVIVWVYYSAQIFFFGAAFTHVYARDGLTGATSAPQKPSGPTDASVPVA